MKAFIFISLFLIQSYLLLAQEPERVMSASYYDSLTRSGDSCNTFNYSTLAGIYKRENKLRELKNTYEMAVQCPLRNHIQRGFYLDLADIYISEGQFRKALDLIILFDSTKNKVMRPHNTFQHVGNFTLANKRSICYKGLGIVDSAIYELSPYMFFKHTYFEGFYDSLSYDSVIKGYLSLLRSKHSATELSRELYRAETNFYFYDIADEKPNRFGTTLHKIICGFPFFKYQIKYLDNGIYVDEQNKMPYPSNFNLGFQFNYFKKTPIYSMIKTL
jgi:hypothetical protein